MGNEPHGIDAKVDTSPFVDAEIARLAAAQLGLVAIWQLLKLGIGRGAIGWRVRVYSVKILDSRDRRMVGRVPVTGPARTVIDLAGVLEPRYVEPLIADAQGRRLLTKRDLERAIDRAPYRPGVALVRSLIEAPKLTRREGERRLLELIREAGLPEPECNAPVTRWRLASPPNGSPGWSSPPSGGS